MQRARLVIRGTEVPERSTELDSYATLGPGSVFGLSELEPSYVLAVSHNSYSVVQRAQYSLIKEYTLTPNIQPS